MQLLKQQFDNTENQNNFDFIDLYIYSVRDNIEWNMPTIFRLLLHDSIEESRSMFQLKRVFQQVLKRKSNLEHRRGICTARIFRIFIKIIKQFTYQNTRRRSNDNITQMMFIGMHSTQPNK